MEVYSAVFCSKFGTKEVLAEIITEIHLKFAGNTIFCW
jgi:hypothetical protein